MNLDRIADLVSRLENFADRIEKAHRKSTKLSRWVSVSKAAEYVGVGKRTLMYWVKNYGIPHIKVPSGTILMELSSLYEWLHTYKVTKKPFTPLEGNYSDHEKEIIEELLEELM
jgi:excisionase family DNA binding protein